MRLYGKAAVCAVRYAQGTTKIAPKVAWSRAMAELSESESSCAKICPREAFLGLCAKGKIVGVSGDKGFSLGKNAGYALRAVELIESKLATGDDAERLWVAVAGQNKRHNGQMDVVVGLFSNGMLAK